MFGQAEPARVSWAGKRRAIRLAWWRHRRVGLVLLVALAAVTGVRIAHPGGPDLRPVLVVRRGLGAGAVVRADDVRRVPWPAAAVPAGLLRDPVGRVLAGPVRAGEALTDARVLGRSLLAGQPEGIVAVVVRPSDGSAGGLVRAGDRVDVLASTPATSTAAPSASDPDPDAGSGAGPPAQRVATGVLVLAVVGAGAAYDAPASGGGLGLIGSDTSGGGSPGPASLVLAVDRAAAQRLAAAGESLLTVALLPPQPVAILSGTNIG